MRYAIILFALILYSFPGTSQINNDLLNKIKATSSLPAANISSLSEGNVDYPTERNLNETEGHSLVEDSIDPKVLQHRYYKNRFYISFSPGVLLGGTDPIERYFQKIRFDNDYIRSWWGPLGIWRWSKTTRYPKITQDRICLEIKAGYLFNDQYSISTSWTSKTGFEGVGYNGHDFDPDGSDGMYYHIVANYSKYNALFNYALIRQSLASTGFFHSRFSLQCAAGPSFLHHGLTLQSRFPDHEESDLYVIHQSSYNNIALDTDLILQIDLGLEKMIGFFSINLNATIGGKYRIPEVTLDYEENPKRKLLSTGIPTNNLGVSFSLGFIPF